MWAPRPKWVGNHDWYRIKKGMGSFFGSLRDSEEESEVGSGFPSIEFSDGWEGTDFRADLDVELA